ncbi:Casein kinase I isoform delta [Mycena indigotica]|uniref:non-specific serine/threonine protein kinase n=1 Tax=Mycena indigotica TaxID=2126181 RepID=A0A8H6S1D4_9AGAR|nr:Casein kinase I isoform delta [Mycena indigotica]KAF7290528.1 Casein kinase I isoform delta [Mycena indigotica]
MDALLGGKYRLEEEIAAGGCGQVFIGVHNVAGKEVAIKLEPAIAKHSPLQQESKIYKRLMGNTGIPWIMWSGRQGDYNVMVIDLLGPSLEDLFKMCNRHFSLKTVLLLADQLISRIEFIHSHGFVHRDIKPANFVMGTGRAVNMVNVIDFGLAKKFWDSRTSLHIPFKQDDFHGVGTSLFAAINTHIGIESSRRDDLESLAYMLIYFLRGTLPWRKLRAPAAPPSTYVSGSHPYNPVSATWDLIRDAKLSAEPLLTCGLPPEFDVLYRYARGLEFDDLPDYAGLRALFRGLAERLEFSYDDEFDWTVPPPKGKPAPIGPTAAKGRYCEACHRRETERRQLAPTLCGRHIQPNSSTRPAISSPRSSHVPAFTFFYHCAHDPLTIPYCNEVHRPHRPTQCLLYRYCLAIAQLYL